MVAHIEPYSQKVAFSQEDKAGLKNVKRLGIIGGSFNPAHKGHIHIAKHAIEILKLDSVWFMVSNQNPWKSKEEMAPMEKRGQSIQKLIDEQGYQKIMHVSMAEKYWNTMYTVDTLRMLKACLPKGIQYFFIMGGDVWRHWHRFKNVEHIMAHTPVVVMARKSSRILKSWSTWRYGWRYVQREKMKENGIQCPAWTYINQPTIEESSTKRREVHKKWWIS